MAEEQANAKVGGGEADAPVEKQGSEKKMNAIVTGGTGATGKWMVKELVQSPKWSRVGVIVRALKPDPATFWNVSEEEAKEKIVQTEVDYEKLDESKEAFQGYTHGFCLLGTTRAKAGSAAAFRRVDHDYVVNSAKLMKDGGVKHFSLMTSNGANANSWFLYMKTKGEAEEGCEKLGFDRYSVFRPGMLFGRNDTTRFMERIGGFITPASMGIEVAECAKGMRLNAEHPRQADASKTDYIPNNAIKQIVKATSES